MRLLLLATAAIAALGATANKARAGTRRLDGKWTPPLGVVALGARSVCVYVCMFFVCIIALLLLLAVIRPFPRAWGPLTENFKPRRV